MKDRGLKLILSLIVLGGSCAAATPGSNQTSSSTPQQVFDGMRESFSANQARGFYARYQFEITGPTGGRWWIEVNDGKYKMGRGKIRDPGVTFKASDRDWVALSNGTLPGVWAYLTGRLKIRGDQNLARKLDEIFR